MAPMIRTFTLVTVIALLVWVWSEGESLRDLSLSPRITFEEGSDLDIETGSDWRGLVQIRLKGSTLAINQAENLLGAPLRLSPGQPGVPALPGESQIIDLAVALREYPDLKRLGVAVTEVDPPSTVARITKLVRRELPIRAEIPAEIELDGEATVTPARVALRLPEAASQALSETAVATAIVEAAELRRLRTDGPQTIVAAVRLPAVLAGVRPLSMAPDKVNITVRLRKGVASLLLSSVPVWIAVPPTEGVRWNIEILDQFLADVTVTGPADLIEKFRKRELVPIAEVRLSSDELDRGVDEKDAAFAGVTDAGGVLLPIPPGVEFSAPSRAIRIAISSRDLGKPIKRNGPGSPEGSP